MTPQELKNSILQLAIQGKLVEQCAEDGTAEELIQKIQAEKGELIRQGKIKKEKKLTEISEDEKPFEIPESWKWVRLSSICSKIVDGDHNPPSGEATPTEYWMLSAQNVNNDALCDLDSVRYLSFDNFKKVNDRTNLQIGDILFTIVGTLGRSCIYEGGYNICFQRSVAVITSMTWNCYLKYALDSAFIQQFMVQNATGTAQKGFYLNQVANLIIPLPPLAEQHRIVAKIESLLPLIDRYKKAWSRLEEFNKRFPGDMQKSLLQIAIQGKLVDQCPEEGTGEELYQQIQQEKARLVKEGKIKKEKPMPEITEDEVPFEVPETWKWVRFWSVISLATNLVPPSEYRDYLHIAPDNIVKGTGQLLPCRTVAEDKVASPNHLFHKGQVIYSKIRPLLRKAVVAPFDGLCSADMYPLDTPIDPFFLKYYLLSDGFNGQIADAMSSRVKMPKINQEELGRVLLPLPPLAEQKRIVAKLEEMLPLCERLK